MATIDRKTIMEDTIAKIRNKMPDELLGKYSEMDGAMDDFQQVLLLLILQLVVVFPKVV